MAATQKQLAAIQSTINQIAQQTAALQSRIATEGITTSKGQILLAPTAPTAARQQTQQQIQKQIETTKTQIADLQSQQTALGKYGLTDTDELTKNASGNYVPKPGAETNQISKDEFKEALEEAQRYYGYTLPTGGAAYRYPEMEAELKKAAETARTRADEDLAYQSEIIEASKATLVKEYQEYLGDVETGKLRIGETKQIEDLRNLQLKQEYLARWGQDIQEIAVHRGNIAAQYELALEGIRISVSAAGASLAAVMGNVARQREIFLDRWQIETKEGLGMLQRDWIRRGGLWSGVRVESAQIYMKKADLAKESYLSDLEGRVSSAQASYQGAVARAGLAEKEAALSQRTGMARAGIAEAQAGLAKGSYLSQTAYQEQSRQLTYQRAMEDYLTQAGKQEKIYQEQLSEMERTKARQEQLTQRTKENVALQEIQGIRTLQETYQQAIAKRMAQTLSGYYL